MEEEEGVVGDHQNEDSQTHIGVLEEESEELGEGDGGEDSQNEHQDEREVIEGEVIEDLRSSFEKQVEEEIGEEEEGGVGEEIGELVLEGRDPRSVKDNVELLDGSLDGFLEGYGGVCDHETVGNELVLHFEEEGFDHNCYEYDEDCSIVSEMQPEQSASPCIQSPDLLTPSPLRSFLKISNFLFEKV